MECYTIDCANIENARQLHQLLHQTLGLPKWYGHNLDALYDCLTERRRDHRIVFNNWPGNADWAANFEAVFADAQEDNPDLHVTFA